MSLEVKHELPTSTERTALAKVLPVSFSQEAGHVAGDTDFGGHGPRVRVKISINQVDTTLVLSVDTIFEETKHDWTRFELRTQVNVYDLLADKGAGWRFAGFRNQYDVDTGDHTLSGYGIHTIYSSAHGLIRAIRVVGDQDGGWGGGDDHPRLDVEFNAIYIEIERVDSQ